MEIIVRTLCAFIALLLFSRLLGKKQMSHITLFNYITGITFGSITAVMAVDKRISIQDGLIWSILTIGISKLALKFPRIRVLLDGEPTIIIKKGKILEKTMASTHLNMDDLSMLLREKDIFGSSLAHIQQIFYAELQSDGTLHIDKRSDHVH